ncbi:MAG: sigma-70 family RNA polymerase sigma factor [Minisyncoccia bacterium]
MESETLKKRFIELYNGESDSIFRFCLLRTSDREVALDLMQDTFISFWEVLSKGRGRIQEGKIQNERAFLFTIARNRIIDWYRKKKTLSLDSLAEDTGGDVDVFMEAAPQGDIELAHEAKFLLEKLKELDPQYQQVVYLRFVEELKPKEIADILGESVNAISVRIHRGIAQLRTRAGYDES